MVLSRGEISDVFNAITNLKHRTLFMTLNATGTRISEALSLKVSDIEKPTHGDRKRLIRLQNSHIL